MPGYQRVKGSNVWLKYHAGLSWPLATDHRS